MSDELYKRFRPKSFRRIVGQEKAIKTLSSYFKGKKTLPHTVLFTGPSGCGKTTLARIVAKKVGCHSLDIEELNTADFRGIDSAREIRSKIGLAPMSGSARCWIVDEAHQLTNQAQNAFLKMWEDTPDHVWFMLCTTDPQKLLPTVRNRSLVVQLQLVDNNSMTELLSYVAKKIKTRLSPAVRKRILDIAEGSPRKCLVLLDAIQGISEEDEQLEAIESSTVLPQAIEIARALINPRSEWSDISKLLKEVTEEPEQIRRMILGYFSSVLLKGGKMAERAHFIILCFSDPYYDIGKAGLIANCYEAMKKS